MYYNKIESNFQRDPEDWTVSNKTANLRTSLDSSRGAIQFNQFEDYPDQELFFIAPAKYKGNKLASYGGNLSFSIRYEGVSAGERPKKLNVRISGAGINLIYYHPPSYLAANRDYKIIIPLYEVGFYKIKKIFLDNNLLSFYKLKNNNFYRKTLNDSVTMEM
jgi:hypothetical protein